MILEMIATGDELLSGQITDTNAVWLAEFLYEHGIEISKKTTIGDELDTIATTLCERSLVADIILVNGGLGPTSDDLSAIACAKATNQPLIENEIWKSRIKQMYASWGREMPVTNLKQCMLPKGAILIDNPVGTACGFAIKLNKAWLFFTPGVPHEFKQMVSCEFIKFLQDIHIKTNKLYLKKFLILGYGEALVAKIVESIAIDKDIKIGYRAYTPFLDLKLLAKDEAINKVENLSLQLKELLGDAIVGEDVDCFGSLIHNLLITHKKSLTIAESCTGGLIASTLIANPGSSEYIKASFVTYSNEAKTKLLEVDPELIVSYGAVSIPVVEAMAKNSRNIINSDYAIATSGVAGPGGGSVSKPIGTVTIALATKDEIYSQKILIKKDSRELVRQVSMYVALDMLRRHILGKDVVITYPMF